MKNILLFSLSLLFVGCVSTNKGYQSTPVKAQKNVWQDMIKTDIIVDDSEKVSGTSKSSYFLFFRVQGDSKYSDGINYSDAGVSIANPLSLINPFKLIQAIFTGGAEGQVKAAAAYDALEGTDADVLIHPSYEITTKNYLIFNKYEAKVTGYTGKYTNFRNENPRDKEFEIYKAISDKVIYEVGIDTDFE